MAIIEYPAAVAEIRAAGGLADGGGAELPAAPLLAPAAGFSGFPTALEPANLGVIADLILAGHPLTDHQRQQAGAVLRLLADRPVSPSSRRGERDRLLRLIRCRHYSGLATATAARALIEASDRYSAGCWRHDRSRPSNPHPDGTLMAALWSLLRLGGPPAIRRLVDIIAE